MFSHNCKNTEERKKERKKKRKKDIDIKRDMKTWFHIQGYAGKVKKSSQISALGMIQVPFNLMIDERFTVKRPEQQKDKTQKEPSNYTGLVLALCEPPGPFKWDNVYIKSIIM